MRLDVADGLRRRRIRRSSQIALRGTGLAWFLPDSGFAPVQSVVAVAYLLAIVGMYGMFYPWRIEKALALVFRRKPVSA